MSKWLSTTFFSAKNPIRKINKTCNLEDEDPELAHIIDESQKVFDFQKGDVLLHTRWLFDCSIPLTSARRAYLTKLGQKSAFCERYLVHYEYGDLCLIKGFTNFEFSALLNPQNKGKALAQINRDDGPFYPKCYPESMIVHEIKNMNCLIANKFPIAETKKAEFLAKIFSKMRRTCKVAISQA